ncbi:hypothetical protein E4T52_13644 [Aureobasidium sp. EXF-3400]|nr:hypothetical protein E4T51_12658 [Aureobasidium sp. EXF-12344]KAI4771357.1 hypothetical protein E4T52_13644 [Aureobasidium sp. EXF-3400]
MSTFTEREPKFAQRAGLTVGSARNAWAALKKKLYAQDDTTAKGTSAKTPGSKSAKKRPPPVALPAGDNDSDDDEVPTPSKKPKTPITNAKPKTKGKGKGKVTKSEDEDEDDFVKVKNEVIDEEFEEV